MNRMIDKFKKYVLVLGAVIACSAPFIHMLYPKTTKEVLELRAQFDGGLISEDDYIRKTNLLLEDSRVFGFPDARKFWYAFGKPLLLLYISFYLIFLYPSIADKTLKDSTRTLSVLLCFVSFYFLVWIFWLRGDFPRNLYYSAIGLVSCAATAISFLVIRHKFVLKKKIQRLIKFISVDSYQKYIKEEDREAYLDDSFSVYDEITKKGDYG